MRPTIRCYPSLPVAQDMREYAGIREDLLQALKYIQEVEEQIAAGSRHLVAWEGLTSAAAVAYGRCFKRSEVRLKLPKDFHQSAPQQIRETHAYVIAVRDKHIAHSENPYEENALAAIVELEHGRPHAVQDVIVKPHRLIAFGDPDVPRLRALFEWSLTEVESLYEKQKEIVLEATRCLKLDDIMTTRMEPTPAFLAEGAHAVTRKR